MMPTVLSVISDCSSAETCPPFSSPLPVSVNRPVPDLATGDNKRKQLQERKLNIPADAFDWECVCVCVRSAGPCRRCE